MRHHIMMFCISILLISGSCVAWRSWAHNHHSKTSTLNQRAPFQDVPLRLVHGTVAGQPIDIDFSKRVDPSLVFVFSPSCPYCRINYHNWRELAKDSNNVTIYWFNVGFAPVTYDFRTIFGFTAAAVTIQDAGASNSDFPYASTPTTLIIDPGGKVEWKRAGVLSSDDVAWLRKRLSHQ